MTSLLVIGMGRFGKYIAMECNNIDTQVMAVDDSEENINEVLPYVDNAQIGDATNIDFLRGLDVASFDACIVAIGDDFQSSLETTLYLKELGAKLVVARASSDVHAKFLRRNGADEVMYPERQLAKWAAIRYTANHIFDYIELGKDHGIFEVEVPKQWLGKTVGELDVRKNFGFNIIATKAKDIVDVNITPATMLTREVNLMVCGSLMSLQKVFKL